MTILRIPIASEAQWLDLRRQNVGASEIAALLGSHPYLSAYGLAGDKSGRIPKQYHDSAAMERGRELEPIAIRKLGRMFPHWPTGDDIEQMFRREDEQLERPADGPEPAALPPRSLTDALNQIAAPGAPHSPEGALDELDYLDNGEQPDLVKQAEAAKT